MRAECLAVFCLRPSRSLRNPTWGSHHRRRTRLPRDVLQFDQTSRPDHNPSSQVPQAHAIAIPDPNAVLEYESWTSAHANLSLTGKYSGPEWLSRVVSGVVRHRSCNLHPNRRLRIRSENLHSLPAAA